MTDDQALGVAFIFGFVYNLFIDWLHTKFGGDGGFVSLEVVAGVLGVLVIGALIEKPSRYQFQGIVLSNAQSAAWLFLRLFAAAGVSMVIGSLWRYLEAEP